MSETLHGNIISVDEGKKQVLFDHPFQGRRLVVGKAADFLGRLEAGPVEYGLNDNDEVIFIKSLKSDYKSSGKDSYWERKAISDERRQLLITRAGALNTAVAFYAGSGKSFDDVKSLALEIEAFIRKAPEA